MAVEMKWTTMIMFGKRHIAEQVNKDGGDSSHIISVTLIRYVLYLTLQFELIFSSPVSVFFCFLPAAYAFVNASALAVNLHVQACQNR